MKKLIVVLTMLIVFGYFAEPGQAEYKKNRAFKKIIAEFSDLYKRSLEENGVVGSSIMLIHDNEVLFKAFYGLANKEKNQKVDSNTIYHWASITKTFTGIAVLQLRDRGLLKLEDPVVNYIPELRMVHNPYGDMNKITIRHLLSHTSGFRGATWPWKDKEWHPHEPLHWEQLVAMFPYTEITFEPGSKFSYSNLGIIFLARIIELLTTDDYEVYVDKNIFKPLKMYNSYFDSTPYHLLKYRSHSYYQEEEKEGETLKPAIFDVNTGITVSNGGLNAPFTDFAKYIDFLMGDPAKQEEYDLVLKRSSLEEMFQSQISLGEPVKDKEGNTISYSRGLAFSLIDYNGRRFIGHTGGQNAFSTFFFVNLSSRTACVGGYNTSGKKVRIAKGKIQDFIFEKIFPLF